MQKLTNGERHRLLVFAGLYACVWLLTWYSARVFETMGVVSLWYLPGGLRFFCLLLLGPTGLGVEILTALVLFLLQTALSSTPAPSLWSTELMWALYNLFAFPMAYAVIVLPLRWRIGKALDFSRPIHSGLFLVAAMGAAALAASAGTFSLVSSGVIANAESMVLFYSWLTGDFIGIITLTPLLWVVVAPRALQWLKQGTWQLPRQTGIAPNSDRIFSKTALAAALALVAIFGLPFVLGVTHMAPLVPLLLLLPLAGLTLRYGLRSAVLAIVLLDSGLVAALAILHQHDGALQFQWVMIAIALVGLWLGGAVEASRRVMERLTDFSSVSNDLLWETDAMGLLTTSGRLSNQLGIAPGMPWSELLKNLSQPHMDALERALSQREPFHRLEVAFRQGVGPVRWFSMNGLPLWDDSGALSGYRGTAAEITNAVEARALLSTYNQDLLTQVAQRTAELTRSHGELAIKEQHLQVLLAAAPVGVLELDSEDQCRYLNDNGCALLGITQAEAQGRNLLELIDPEDRARAAQSWYETSPEMGVKSVEFRLQHSSLWCAAYWIKFRPLDHPSDSTIVVLVDATARHLQEQQLWALAHHDALTGLPNRALFLDRCNQVFAQTKRRDSGAAMLWLDLDGFKSVNDTLGHAAGDALLQQVAQRLKSRVRDGDTVARMGGDEFAAILPDISQADGALHMASALVDLLGTPYDLPQGTVTISASIGVALYPSDANTVETLMQQADSAMYQVKRSGKNKVRLAGADS